MDNVQAGSEQKKKNDLHISSTTDVQLQIGPGVSMYGFDNSMVRFEEDVKNVDILNKIDEFEFN